MRFITDEEVSQHISMAEAINVMRTCFKEYSQGQACVLGRTRTELNGKYLSVMGGVLAQSGIMAAKIYPTLNGQFNFVIPLFSSETGKLLSVLEGNALTGLRTAAVTRVVLEQLYTGKETTLTIFGTGIQAYAHARALIPNSTFTNILVCGIEGAEDFARKLQADFGVTAQAAQADIALQSDVIITATRSPTPLFSGDLVQPNAIIAAIGSSKPTNRELDEATLAKAAAIIVEWKAQTLAEAGEFALLQGKEEVKLKTIEIGELINAGSSAYKTGIRIYKSVGIGIEDVGLANYIYQKITTH